MRAGGARAAYSYRQDAAVPPFPDDRPVIVFDGFCVLCSGTARFVIRHDKGGRFRFAAAQSPLGRALYAHYGLDPVVYDTFIVLTDGIASFRSDAALTIAQGLGLPWSAATPLRILPVGLRDRVYVLVARDRLRLFGSRQSCMRPPPGQVDRFIA